MCGGFSTTFSFFAALAVIGAHFWFYLLNQSKIVDTVNLFGYKYENVSISDIYAACIIWVTCLFLTYLLSTSCQDDNRDDQIRTLKREKNDLKKKCVELKQKLEELQKVTKRIELMVPYDLNTLVEQKMWNHIPDVLYSPIQTEAQSRDPAPLRTQYTDVSINHTNHKRPTLTPIRRLTRDRLSLNAARSSSVRSSEIRTSELLKEPRVSSIDFDDGPTKKTV